MRRDPRVSLTVLREGRLVHPRHALRRRRAARGRSPTWSTSTGSRSATGAARSGTGESPRVSAWVRPTRWTAWARAYAQPVTSQRRPAKRHPISASRTQIRTKSAAQTPTIPQSKTSAASETSARDRERRDHRPHQEPPVAGADQDPVEREDGAVQRLHQREKEPDRLRPLDQRASSLVKTQGSTP